MWQFINNEQDNVKLAKFAPFYALWVKSQTSIRLYKNVIDFVYICPKIYTESEQNYTRNDYLNWSDSKPIRGWVKETRVTWFDAGFYSEHSGITVAFFKGYLIRCRFLLWTLGHNGGIFQALLDSMQVSTLNTRA